MNQLSFLPFLNHFPYQLVGHLRLSVRRGELRGKREELSKQSQGLQDVVWHHFNEHEKRHNLVGAHSLELFTRHADALSKAKPLSAQHRDLKETLGELSHRMSQDARLMREIASTHPHLLESIAAHTQNHVNTLQHAYTQGRGRDL